MTGVLALLTVMMLAVGVLRLRRLVAQMEKDREVVDRHLAHLAWRLDGEPGPEPSDQHLVVSLREREPDRPH